MGNRMMKQLHWASSCTARGHTNMKDFSLFCRAAIFLFLGVDVTMTFQVHVTMTFRDQFYKLESVRVIFQVQSGGGGWKILIVGHCFSGIFDNSWPNLISHSGYCSKAYNSCNHGHAPGQHMWQSLGQRPNSKCSKKVCEELNSVSAGLP